MDLSIIIAHYDPGNHPDCVQSFHETIKKIFEQKESFSIEIIIADDGSPPHSEILQNYSDTRSESGKLIYHLRGSKLQKYLEQLNLPEGFISNWIYLPKEKPQMGKARLGNAAIELAKADNILFLDDDNYFISENTISVIMEILMEYHLVFGQIKDSNGRLRPFSSNRVQGTTFAVKKNIMKSCGGFGDWTEKVSSGVDSDIWWKLYHYFQKHPKLKACYTSKVQTLDSCSKRWKPHIRQLLRHRAVRREFEKIHGCPNYRSARKNPSRVKTLWMENLL